MSASEAEARAERIRTRLGATAWRKLFAAVRARVEQVGVEAHAVSLRLDPGERRVLADLFGWAEIPASPVRLRLARLDEVLRASGLEAGLEEVLEALGGPLVDRRATRRAARDARAAIWEGALGHPVVAARPALGEWIEEVRSRGLLARAADGEMQQQALLHQAIEIAGRLPAHGVLLPVLATEVAGDAHLLDAGTPLAGLVLRAAARIAGWPSVPAGAAARRALWAEVGVLCDPLSSQVLVLGLRPKGDRRLARHLRESAQEGEPSRLTLRELAGCELGLESDRVVSVCENPSVVAAAAERLGARSGPLVCTEGLPSTAALELLRTLVRGGARLRFRADFDWAGVRIGNQLAGLGGVPWRFAGADYLAWSGQLEEAMGLVGAPAEASWDPGLGVAMQQEGRALFEEQGLELLLEDLGAG